MRTASCIAVLLAVLSMACAGANAAFLEDFDGAGTVPYTLTNSSGDPPAILTGGSTNTYARLVNLTGSNNNSIAFDEDPSTTGPSPAGMKLAFDFRMTDNAANDAAGGCCGSAADGVGIGIFATERYGASGAANPGAGDGGSAVPYDWERGGPFADAFSVGLRVFDKVDVVQVSWDDTMIAELDVQPMMDLNNNRWHRAIVDVKPDGANALVDVTLLEDINGPTSIHSVVTDLAVPGLDLASLPSYRVIAGGRTGGAFVDGDLDNIALVAVPEPTSLALLGLGGMLMLISRRRRS